MFRIFMLPLIAIAALAGCETIGGAGQDIETAGEAIQQESNEVQRGM